MPRVDPRQTFGGKARFYATSEVHTEERSLAAMSRLARVSPGTRVLDVATGAGHAGARPIEEGAAVIGLDITLPMLLEAQGLYEAKGLMLIQADVARMPFPDGTFDLGVSRRAPHHFPDIDACLRSMRNALKPGGALVIDDRSVPEDDFADRTINHLDALHDRSHVRDYRPSEWRGMLERHGLVLEHMETYERRRPLDSLTRTALEEDAREIERGVRSLDEGERARLGIEEDKDGITVTHWFVLLRAVRP